ncbi:MAG: hypothetical protein RSH78_03935 [Bacilli bacterium]
MLVKIKGSKSIWKFQKKIGEQAYLVPPNGAWGIFCIVDMCKLVKVVM